MPLTQEVAAGRARRRILTVHQTFEPAVLLVLAARC
jgi:hypothetical protein